MKFCSGKLGRRLSRGDSRKLLLDDVLGGKFSYESYSTLWISGIYILFISFTS